jgi:hypothetical protein
MKNITITLILNMLELLIKNNPNKCVQRAIGYAYANANLPIDQFITETANDIGLYYNKLSMSYNIKLQMGKALMITIDDDACTYMETIRDANPTIKCMYTIVNNCK